MAEEKKETVRIRIVIAPKDAKDCARICAQIGGLLERGIER